jgi:hypothetical protein
VSTRVFVCFDARNDADLRQRFAEQCNTPGSTLAVVDWSRPDDSQASRADKLRGRMAGVDVVVVLCGEHTDDSANVNRELGAALQEGRPYLLLWARRSGMCTRPVGAKATDHFYTCTWDVVSTQVDAAVRRQHEIVDRDLGGLRGKRKS